MEEAFYQAAGFHMDALADLIRVSGAALVCLWCAWIYMGTVNGLESGRALSTKSIVFRCLGGVFVTVMVLFVFGTGI